MVYKTADFHKPWAIGVTADPAIQALIDELNTQLGPIFTGDRRLDRDGAARGLVRTARRAEVRVDDR